MEVKVKTYLKGATMTILKEQFEGPDLESITYNNEDYCITLIFKDDMEYRELAGWIGAALGCGLITGGNIER